MNKSNRQVKESCSNFSLSKLGAKVNRKSSNGSFVFDKAADVSKAFDRLYLHVSPIPRPANGYTRVIGEDFKKCLNRLTWPDTQLNLGKPVESEYGSSLSHKMICDGADGILKNSNFIPSSPELFNTSLESHRTSFGVIHNTTFNRIQAITRKCAVVNSTAIDQDAKLACSLSIVDGKGKNDSININEQQNRMLKKDDPLQTSAFELNQKSEERTSKYGQPKAIEGNVASSAEIRKSKRIQQKIFISSSEKNNKNNPNDSPVKKAHKKNMPGDLCPKELPNVNEMVIPGRKKATRTQLTVLTDWIIKPIPGSHAVCVEGQKIGMNDFWHSTAISEVKKPKIVVTVSGSTYHLKGRINRLCTIDNGFSKDIADAFTNGFPKNWRELIQDFYNDIEKSITIHGEKAQPTGKKKSFKLKSSPKKKKTGKEAASEKNSTVWTPVGLIQKEINQADVVKTRSGRISLPPLATWVGQRYIQVEGTNKIQIGCKTKAAEQALNQVTNSFLNIPKSKLPKTYHKNLSQSLHTPTTTKMLNRKDVYNKNDIKKAKAVLSKSHLSLDISKKTLKSPEALNETSCKSKKEVTSSQNNIVNKHKPNVSDNTCSSSHQKLKLRKYSQMLSVDVPDNCQPVSGTSAEQKQKNSSFNKVHESKAKKKLTRKSNISVSNSDEPKKKSLFDTSSKKSPLKRRTRSSESSQEQHPRRQTSSHEKTMNLKQKNLVDSSPEKCVQKKQTNLSDLSQENILNSKRQKRKSSSPEDSLRPTKIKKCFLDSHNKDNSEKELSHSNSSFAKSFRVRRSKQNKCLNLSKDDISLSSNLLAKGENNKNKAKVCDDALENKASRSKTKSRAKNISKNSDEGNNDTKIDRQHALKGAVFFENQRDDSKTNNQQKLIVSKNTENESWTVIEEQKFNEALKTLDSDLLDYWQQVSRLVGTRSEKECQLFHKEFLESKLVNPRKADNKKQKSKISGRQKGEPIKGGKGTLKRKQGLREFLDEQNEGYEDKLFEGTPYLSKKPKNLITIDFNKNDAELFGTNHNAFTPVADSSQLSTPGTKLRAAMASVRKIPTESSVLIGNTPVSTCRRLKADRLIKHFHERKKQSRSLTPTDRSPEQNVNLNVIDIPIKALFSPTNPSVFVDDDDDDKEPYYWEDE